MRPARPAAWFVATVAAAAPWAFGATEPSWAALLAVLCLVPFAAALLLDAASPAPERFPRSVLVAALAVVLVAAVGLVPAPEAVRGILVPGGTRLLAAVAPETAGTWRPLSLAPHATAGALALAAGYVGAFLLLGAEARRRGGRAVVTSLLALSGVALAGLGIAQHLTQRDTLHPLIYWTFPVSEAGTPFGPYVNRNHFAGAMAVLSAIAAGECLALWGERRRAAAAAFGAAAVAMLSALAATTSRGGALGAATAGAVLVLAAPGGRRLRGVFLAVSVVGVLAAVLAWTGILDSFLARAFTLSGRWQDRFGVQRDALSTFLAHPLVGVGAGTFEQVYPPFQRVCDDRSFQNAHSDWAQILMETGLAGAAAAALALRCAWGWFRDAAGDAGPRRFRIAGPLAGAAAVAVHGFFDVNLHVPANALLTVSALSLAFAASAGPLRESDVPPVP